MKLLAKTHKGIKRQTNQDTIMVNEEFITNCLDEETFKLNYPVVLQLCDGMGGFKEGKKASEFVANNFYREFSFLNQINLNNLNEIIIRSHEALLDFSKSRHGFFCMGTTIASVVVLKEDIWILNVGDTQIYSLKKTKSKLESETHIVDKEDPSVLSQCIGGNGKGRLKPFIKKIYKKDFDQLLILSDGIHLHRSEWLNKIDFTNISTSLFYDALKNGSTDDMSFIFLEL